jgi:hypothetical protein
MKRARLAEDEDGYRLILASSSSDLKASAFFLFGSDRASNSLDLAKAFSGLLLTPIELATSQLTHQLPGWLQRTSQQARIRNSNYERMRKQEAIAQLLYS